jgi:hypothetical protein
MHFHSLRENKRSAPDFIFIDLDLAAKLRYVKHDLLLHYTKELCQVTKLIKL